MAEAAAELLRTGLLLKCCAAQRSAALPPSPAQPPFPPPCMPPPLALPTTHSWPKDRFTIAFSVSATSSVSTWGHTRGEAAGCLCSPLAQPACRLTHNHHAP